MGRLNYANRKSEGPKLGQIVAKDLRKRAAQFLVKPTETTSLELNLHGKNLTDEGFDEIANALIEVLTSDVDGVCCYKLEELNLASNGMTWKSLRSLGRVVAAASYDLKNLDLSGNLITASQPEEAAAWQIFLDDFKNCRALRKLDLGGNDFSGPQPFEIFVRVYAKHLAVDPTELGDIGIHDMTTTDVEKDTTDLVKRTRAMSIKERNVPSYPSTGQASMSDPLILKRRRGLRSIPYITFSNSMLTDSGALFLSYILANHYYPQQLMCPTSNGNGALQLEESHHASHCWGLVYLPNERVTSLGRKLLENAEVVRQELLGINEDVPLESFPSSYEVVNAMQSSPAQRHNVQSFDFHRRRSSTMSSGVSRSDSYTNISASATVELESFRKKIQRSTIEVLGAGKVQLWSAAVKTLVCTRAILLGCHAHASSRTLEQEPPRARHDSQSSHSAASEGSWGNIKHTLAAMEPKGSMSASQVIDFGQRYPVSGSSQQRSLLQLANQQTENNGQSTTEERATDANSYRDLSLPCNLPLQIWQRIINFAVDPSASLNEEKQMRVMSWGMDRSTLVSEREILGKPESVQIWRVLESIGCLAYDIKI